MDMNTNYQRLIHELYSGINTRMEHIGSPTVKPLDFSPSVYGDAITPSVEVDPSFMDLVQKVMVLRRVAEAQEAKEKQEANKGEYDRDLQDLKKLTDSFDDMWRNQLGGDASLSNGYLSNNKMENMKASKEAAVSAHDSTISGLESEEYSLQSQIASASEEDKPALQEKLKDVTERLEAEKARKKETEDREEEKIKQRKEEIQQLKDKLFKLREEARLYKEQLELAGNYEYSVTSKENIQWRLYEIKYEETSLQQRLTELTS